MSTETRCRNEKPAYQRNPVAEDAEPETSLAAPAAAPCLVHDDPARTPTERPDIDRGTETGLGSRSATSSGTAARESGKISPPER